MHAPLTKPAESRVERFRHAMANPQTSGVHYGAAIAAVAVLGLLALGLYPWLQGRSNCHLVTSTQEQVNVDVPTFEEIANMQDQTEGSIMAKIVIPKHPMPVIPITQSELKGLAAYIMSLRDPVIE